MKKTTRASIAVASTLTLTALLVACGGGGGGGSTGGGGGTGGGTPPTPVTSPSATPTASPGATGTLTVGSSPLANDTVVFTCGCNGDGGKITTDANGNYALNGTAPSVLGNGTYTVSGNNLLIVGYTSTGTQSWTMLFLGATPSHNLNLSSTPNNASANVSDAAATAASLYVYWEAGSIPSSDQTFDWFNFNQIQAFAQHLRTAPDAIEQKFLTDVVAAQTAGKSLFPGSQTPKWSSAVSSDGVNATITADVEAVGKDTSDSTIPTLCPSINGCSNAPTP